MKKIRFSKGRRRGGEPTQRSKEIMQQIAQVGERLVEEDNAYPTIDAVLASDPHLKRGTVNKYSWCLDDARDLWEGKNGQHPHRRRSPGGLKRQFIDQEARILQAVARAVEAEKKAARALEERDAALSFAKREKLERMRLEKIIEVAGLSATGEGLSAPIDQ